MQTNALIVPTPTPRRRLFLTAEWRHLLMLNYPVPPQLVAPFVPRGVELDLFKGETFVSLVGFQFLRARLWGAAIPGYRSFPEVNLRLYVRRQVGEEVRRGVVFIKEVVGRRAVAGIARWFYNEPYVVRPIRDEVDFSAHVPPRVRYSFRPTNAWCSLAAEGVGRPRPLAAGSLEEYIAEHYYGYGRLRDGRTVEYHVEHPPWQVWDVGEAKVTGDLTSLYGPEFGRLLAASPQSAFLSAGSAITVAWPQVLGS